MSFLHSKWFVDLTFVAILIVTPCGHAAESTKPLPKHDLRVGASAIDISPLHFPVIINGHFVERTANQIVDPLFARAFVFDNGHSRIAIVIVDSCMLPRELLDAAKSEASKRTGIPTDHILISATHTHSAPSCMGCLGSRPDPEYPAFLIPRLARVIDAATSRLQPAKIGFASLHAPEYTYCRRYIRRPDRVIPDPFGELTVRANMHPGFLSPDAIGPSGPVDDELSLIAIQTAAGKPLGVLANFSMHYVSSPVVSSDYFGRFAKHLSKQLDGSDGATSCIVAMSQGTSGDLASMNYSTTANSREYDSYAKDLAQLVFNAYKQVKYEPTASLAMREAKLTLDRRVPDAQRLEWAQKIAEKIGDRLPKTQPEIYALEQIQLHAEPQRELKLQAIRIGDIAIVAIPNEVYAITGHKIKMQSPLAKTFNIELANGAEGYIPPPEQHKLGGYTTWPARTAALEVEAEPKIVALTLDLLEQVTEKPRRAVVDLGGEYAATVLASKPRAYWRLADFSDKTATDISGNHVDARYGNVVAHYLPGPPRVGMTADGQASRAAHLVGGTVAASVPDLGDIYSIEFWFWNGLPNDARPITACLYSRVPNGNDSQTRGDELTIGGTEASPGHLIFTNGSSGDIVLTSQNVVEPNTWNHVVLTREGDTVRAFLNGKAEPSIDGKVPNRSKAIDKEWRIGGRADGESTLEGKLSDVAIYNRALASQEAFRHYQAAGGLLPGK